MLSLIMGQYMHGNLQYQLSEWRNTRLITSTKTMNKKVTICLCGTMSATWCLQQRLQDQLYHKTRSGITVLCSLILGQCEKSNDHLDCQYTVKVCCCANEWELSFTSCSRHYRLFQRWVLLYEMSKWRTTSVKWMTIVIAASTTELGQYKTFKMLNASSIYSDEYIDNLWS